jgi:hypothetical protein
MMTEFCRASVRINFKLKLFSVASKYVSIRSSRSNYAITIHYWFIALLTLPLHHVAIMSFSRFGEWKSGRGGVLHLFLKIGMDAAFVWTHLCICDTEQALTTRLHAFQLICRAQLAKYLLDRNFSDKKVSRRAKYEFNSLIFRKSCTCFETVK